MSGGRAFVKRIGGRGFRLLALTIFATCAFNYDPPSIAAQCPTGDKSINKRIRFVPGKSSTTIRDTVRLCTSHEYALSARAGQTMIVRLVTGKKTSFTVYSPNERVSEGVKRWTEELRETGEYQIIIGTDATARYTLEVTIR